MKFEENKKIYFIGVGGIGMSAIARYFLKNGSEIHGYDRTKNELTKKLEAEGIQIEYSINPDRITSEFDLVIYTPAIPVDHPELLKAIQLDIPTMKRAEVLGAISAEKRTLAIAGTHGKTTTSSVLSHILKYCNTGASALIGGIMKDYGGNFIYGDGEVLVTEADEYDRSFLHLKVEKAAIMSMDADHLDIYSTHAEMIEGFERFTERISNNGLLYLRSGLNQTVSKTTRLNWNVQNLEIIDFGEKDARLFAHNHRVRDGRVYFDIRYLGETYSDFNSCLPGKYNAENIAVAVAMAMSEGLEVDQIREAISGFQGIKRRFESVLISDNIKIFDDYAHHPTEINAAIGAAKLLYPTSKLTVVFQPHLFSRTKDFYYEFAKELQKADQIILTNIYPARELPREGITSKLIYDEIEKEEKYIIDKSEIVQALKKLDHEVILILGAGDIDNKIKGIKEIYN